MNSLSSFGRSLLLCGLLTAFLQLNGQNPPALNAVATDITCKSDSAVLTAVFNPLNIRFEGWTGPNGYFSALVKAKTTQPGNYTVTIKDTLTGLSNFKTVSVAVDTAAPLVDAGPTGHFGCDIPAAHLMGSATSAHGTPFLFHWTTINGNIVSGADTPEPTTNAFGRYFLTVTDTLNGCTGIDTTWTMLFDSLKVKLEQVPVQHVTCFGAADGQITAMVSGGAGGHTLNWTNGAHSNVISNLAIGTYTLLVIDAAGCTKSASATITQPAQLVGNISASGETLPGAHNGQAAVAPSGGTAPYTYLWNTGATSATLNGLTPGTYTVTVSDVNGCSTVERITVNAFNCNIGSTLTTTNVLCSGADNGSATLLLTNAPPPVTVMWSNGANTLTATGLEPGQYAVTATDGSGCTQVRSVTIVEPQPIGGGFYYHVDELCINGSDGYLAANAYGGMPPFGYSWSNGTTGELALNLSPGIYTVTIQDANGCTTTREDEIIFTDTIKPSLQLQNASVSLGLNGTVDVLPSYVVQVAYDAQCSYSVTLSPGHFDCFQPGPHAVTVTVTDANGNSTAKTTTVTVIDNVYPTFDCPDNITVGLCQEPVFYQEPVVTDNCQVDQAQIERISGLPSGALFPLGTTHQIYHYTDAFGNTGACVFSVTVISTPIQSASTQIASCINVCDGSATVDVGGAGDPYTIHWDDGQTEFTAANLCAGNHSYTLTDAFGCHAVYSVFIGHEPDLQAPFLLVNNASASIGPEGTLTVDASIFNSGSYDFCGIEQFIADPPTFTCADLGTQNVFVTAVDYSGNSTGGWVELTLTDQLPPELDCPDNIITGTCAPAVTFIAPVFHDNCSAAPASLVQTAGLPSGAIFPTGTSTQVFTASDQYGNTASCSFTVTVQELNLSVTQISDDLDNTGAGSIDVAISGGNPPYTFEWTQDAQFFAATEDLHGLHAGVYQLLVTDASGCTVASLAIDIQNTVITSEPVWASGLHLYPNPAREFADILINSDSPSRYTVEIFDVTGRQVLRLEEQGKLIHLNLENLSAGTFIVRILNNSGEMVARKLIRN